jgi:hypothetical protein
MKFTLEVKAIEFHELGPATPFLPEDDEYEMYLIALLEDLSRITAISKIWRNGSTFQIEPTCSMLQAEMSAFIKPVFNNDIINNLRFVSLVDS